MDDVVSVVVQVLEKNEQERQARKCVSVPNEHGAAMYVVRRFKKRADQNFISPTLVTCTHTTNTVTPGTPPLQFVP